MQKLPDEICNLQIMKIFERFIAIYILNVLDILLFFFATNNINPPIHNIRIGTSFFS